ncbi:MAG: B12-binding domain-containing radical SAM protein, partial [Proteobacteria bacterium]|nr:B12-binding domain-containing radical SAM protein [Pseudomonadota bacterium]
ANIMPPLGLASIAAYLDRFQIDSHIIDCYAHPESDALIKKSLEEHPPIFIGFSCTTSSFLDGIRIADYAKKMVPKTKIVFGGVHVSALKEKILESYPIIDYVVVGEGEHTLHQLLRTNETDLEKIKNIVFRKKTGRVVFTGYRHNLIDLDTLPYPAYEKLSGYPSSYKLPIFNYPKVPNASCISSRGCPYSCSYCDRSVFKKSFRYNSAQYLYNHLKYLKDNFNIQHINFYDDQFTFNRSRVEDFARMMIQKPLGMTFNCAARAEHLDLELLKLMKAAGCWMISLGIETGDETLLAQHRQNPDLKMMSDKIHLIKKAGIRVKGLLMMGLPGESEESIKKSKAYVFSLPIDDFNLAKFTPFPGSPIYKDIKEKGEKIGTFTEDWEKMDCMQFLFIPKGLTKQKMDALFIDFYKSHFKRTKVLMGYVSMLWKSPDSWIRFIRDMAGFLKFAFTNKRMG